MFSVVSRWSHVWRVSSYAAKWSWPLVSLKSVHLSSATDGNWWLQRLMQMDRLMATDGLEPGQGWTESELTAVGKSWRRHHIQNHAMLDMFAKTWETYQISVSHKNVSQCVSATKSSSNWIYSIHFAVFPKFFSSSVFSVSSVEAKSEAQGILTNDVSLARFIAEIAFVYTNRAEWCAFQGFRGVCNGGMASSGWPPGT